MLAGIHCAYGEQHPPHQRTLRSSQRTASPFFFVSASGKASRPGSIVRGALLISPNVATYAHYRPNGDHHHRACPPQVSTMDRNVRAIGIYTWTPNGPLRFRPDRCMLVYGTPDLTHEPPCSQTALPCSAPQAEPPPPRSALGHANCAYRGGRTSSIVEAGYRGGGRHPRDGMRAQA